jgi:hypothetical protein
MNFAVFSVSRCTLSILVVVGLAGCGQSNEPAADASPTTATPAATLTASVPAAAATPISQLDLAANFESSTEILLKAAIAGDLAKLKPFQQVRLTPAPNGLTVTPAGNDPGLLLPPFAQGKKFMIKIAVDSPADDATISILYMQRDLPQFDGARSYTNALKKGQNVTYFQVDKPDLIDPVRVEFSPVKGDYVIQSVEVRALAKSSNP